MILPISALQVAIVPQLKNIFHVKFLYSMDAETTDKED
jgi:hypothetical protein